MGAINCKTYDTGEIVAEIRENRRYALASPSTVTGTPSLAMQSAAQMAVVYIYINDVKLSTPLTVSGTTKTPITVNGANPSKEDLLALSFEVTGIGSGEVLLATDEPNGSPPASPFASEAQRTAWATANLASLLPGRTTAWGPGDSTEYVWKGPLATDWQGIRGPYLGSAENPYPTSTTPADLAALAATGPEEIWLINPAVPRGKSRLAINASRTNYTPPAGEPIAIAATATEASPIALVTPGVTTLTQLWVSPIIPDYMLPILLEMDFDANIGSTNSITQANQTFIGIGISGDTPAGAENLAYPIAWRGAPSSSFPKGFGAATNRWRAGVRYASSFRNPHPIDSDGSASIASVACGPFVPGANRLFVMAKPGHVSDTFRFDRAAVYSKGNI